MEHQHSMHRNRFCEFEPVVPGIETMRVMIVNDLIQEPEHFSDIARRDPDFDETRWLKLERHIGKLALGNIESNVHNLVKMPEIQTIHFSELSQERLAQFDPDALLLSGSLRDFDYYNPSLIEKFNQFIRQTTVPVLAICGGHQLVGQAFGANIVTLDEKPPHEKRSGRVLEYQYRFVKITDVDDPIFTGIDDRADAHWQKYTRRKHLLRVWQNHGLQLDRLPQGFRHLARGYLSEFQMMVRRTAQQLIYGVQFHIEKSFQDWQLDNYWNHRTESRDGRFIFERFLREALHFREATGQTSLAERNIRALPATAAGKSVADENQSADNLTGF
jgi:GMP synthase-like glutamine amidotransferase